MNCFRKRTLLVNIGLAVVGIGAAAVVGTVLPQRTLPPSVSPGLVLVGPGLGELTTDLHRLSMDDPELIRIGVDLSPGYIDPDFTVSPDGEWIAFIRPIGRNTTGDLYRIGVDGKDQVQLSSQLVGEVDWSPDGEWIAYTDYHNIYLTRPDGTGQWSPTEGNWSLTFSHITWSPDSFWIAFSHGNELWMVAADASEIRFLERDAGAPVWSPDGEWIAFARPQAEMIYRIRPDGSGLEPLVTGQHPAWSPDGTHIAFFSHTSTRWFFNLLSLANLSVRELYSFEWGRTSADRDLSYPAWSPDGRWIAFILDYQRLFFFPVTGGEIQAVDEYVISFSWLPPVCQGECEVSFDGDYWAAAQVLRTPTPRPTPIGTLTPTPGPPPCCDPTSCAPTGS